MPGPRRSRGHVVIGVSLLLILAADAGVLLMRRPPATVTVADAVEAFRQGAGRGEQRTPPSTARESVVALPTPSGAPPPGATAAPASTPAAPATTPSPAARPLPAAQEPTQAPRRKAGVYVYLTDGFEQVDLLGGSRHDYPERTAVTVSHTDCGESEAWTPVEGRLERTRTCPASDGWTLQSLYSARTFYGQRDELRFDRCTEGLVVEPGAYGRASRSSGTCHDDASGSVLRLSVAAEPGERTFRVEGTAVSCAVVTGDGRISGAITGRVRESRCSTRNGTLVWWERETTATSEQNGITAHYEEKVTLQLAELEPRQ